MAYAQSRSRFVRIKCVLFRSLEGARIEGKLAIEMRFRDRISAGRELEGRLSAYANRPDVLVLALPRGGVPVGFEVAQALRAPLDVFVVRKLGVPGHEELAMGAIATGDVIVLNQDVVQGWQIPRRVIEDVAATERSE